MLFAILRSSILCLRGFRTKWRCLEDGASIGDYNLTLCLLTPTFLMFALYWFIQQLHVWLNRKLRYTDVLCVYKGRNL